MYTYVVQLSVVVLYTKSTKNYESVMINDIMCSTTVREEEAYIHLQC